MLIAGLGTPAFASTTPTSDIVEVRISSADLPGPITLVYTFPEASETTVTPVLSSLGSPFGPDIPFFIDITDHPVIIRFDEPTTLGGGISDIFVIDPRNIVCPMFTQLCFVSDDDRTALDLLHASIIFELPSAITGTVTETGQLQEVFFFNAGMPHPDPTQGSIRVIVTISVQSDVGSEPNGGGGGGTGGGVGGEILPIDMTALFVAGIFTNSFWMIPTLGGVAGAIITLFKIRRKNG